MIKKLSIITLTFGLLFSFLGCEKEEKEGCTRSTALNYDKDAKKDNGSCVDFINLDQSLLDITNVSHLEPHTGILVTNQDGGPVDTFKTIHGGTNTSDVYDANNSVRYIYASIDLKTETPKPGDIVLKKTYKKDPNTGKADFNQLRGVTVLHKQSKGYWANGGDWEYIVIDKATITDKNPNGILPPVSNTEMRGKINMCIGCHKSGGADYLFYK